MGVLTEWNVVEKYHFDNRSNEYRYGQKGRCVFVILGLELVLLGTQFARILARVLQPLFKAVLMNKPDAAAAIAGGVQGIVWSCAETAHAAF